MEFHEYIGLGVQIAGSQKKLATLIGVRESHMSDMAKGKRPVPAEALAKLALLLDNGTTPGQIWESQQAARAATEEEKQLWLPFVKHARGMARAASLLMTMGLAALASVIIVLTPTSNAQAKSMTYANGASQINIMRRMGSSGYVVMPPFLLGRRSRN
jgi:plasmid maintenance system antidote protein VapI